MCCTFCFICRPHECHAVKHVAIITDLSHSADCVAVDALGNVFDATHRPKSHRADQRTVYIVGTL
jgi:hypothetical protein